MGLPTPDTGHLRRVEYATVYDPAEDTFLLLDALENDRAELHARRPTICVEIGSGSGCVSAFLAQVLSPYGALVLSTDINPAANSATRETVAKAPSESVFDQCRTRFVQGLDSRLRGNIDVLVFNPPYVVTPSAEVDSTIEAAAWAGGVRGREVLDLLIPQVPALLSPGGRFYLVVIEQNKPEEIIAEFAALGLAGQRVLSRRAGIESLSILRFIKPSSL
ncbi:HemK methyltransferase member 2 [Coemansia aciculifera]|uniref:HemK methyltransferase member 2 n=1 Tax=Coemansia aciculifera TaxID=417176 RepID=A0ACC1M357_9FUNG|nr:HemK methyltransferase member 2 [Coemansia aciculifera]